MDKNSFEKNGYSNQSDLSNREAEVSVTVRFRGRKRMRICLEKKRRLEEDLYREGLEKKRKQWQWARIQQNNKLYKATNKF